MPSDGDQSRSTMQKVRPARLQTLRIIWALILREASSRFGRSTGGYLWAFAEPIAGILLLSIAFSYLLRSPPIGDSFFLFYTSGVVPVLFFNAISGSLAQSIAANKGLLSYPVVSVLDVILARSLLDFVTYLTVFTIICLAVVQIDRVHLQPDLLQIVFALLLTGLTGMAIGKLNAMLFLFYPVWRSIWRILTRPLLLISGVIFVYEDMPHALQSILWYNPLLQLIGLLRGGLYSSYDDSYVSVTYLILFILGLMAPVAWLIRQNESRLIQQ